LAERLGYAQVDHVVALTVTGNTVDLQRKVGRGAREAVTTTLPAVITVDPGGPEPATAGLPALIGARRAGLPVWDLAELGLGVAALPQTPGAVTGFAPPRRRPRKSAADKALTPQQRMRQMMGGGAAAKAGGGKKVVEGPAAKLAAELIAFLQS